MATQSNVPRDVQDSIREVLGRRVKLFIKRMLKQEIRPDKFENRVLVYSGCRLFVFSPKVPAKLEVNFNYLDIQAIESKKPNQLVLTVDSKTYSFVSLEAETDEVNHMITHISTSLKHIFPAFSLERLIKKIEIQPEERTKTMKDMMKTIESKETGPCGGFTMMYACMCDYYSLPFRAEVEWDIDTIYLSQDSRELCLRDFDHLESKDLVPIIGALEHNIWFKKLNANGVRLVVEAQNEVLKVMKRNAVIEDLSLSGTGINPDFVQKLSTAILSNSSTQLSSIDLSNNPLDDRSITHLIGNLGSLSRGLVKFDISRTKVTGKGLGKVSETLSQNQVVGSTLQGLHLADNPTKGEELQKLCTFLANPNTLTHLDLSGTDCVLSDLCGALLRGCSAALTHLNLSKNIFSNKKAKDVSVSPSWKQFFASVYALEHLDLSSCKLPPEALREMLLGVASNIHIANLHVDISSNDLQSQGAVVLESCIANINSITSLDISNNGLDQHLTNVLVCMRQNKGLRNIAIGRNFEHIRPRSLSSVLDGIVQLIQEEDSSIESLSLADSKLKHNLSTVLNSLGSNVTLTDIDISGNNMADFGARILSKALQINTKLRSIKWDRNNTTYQGFEDIAEALEMNYTLRRMPVPVHDTSAAIRHQADKTEVALQKIEMLLQRNHSPQKYSSDQGFRMQQGFLVSSTQQMMDRLVVQNQDTINALSIGPCDPYKSDMDSASSIIKDADNSKQLLPRLQGIANKSLASGSPVYMSLKEMSENLRQVLDKEIKKTVEGMIECTSNQCAAIMSHKEVLTDLEKGCVEKSALPKDFTKHILDSVETEIFNKLSEINLAVAAHISDQVMDEVIESLSTSHKKLTNHLNEKKSGKLLRPKEGEKSDTNEKIDAGKEKTEDPEPDTRNLLTVNDTSPTLPHWEWLFVEDADDKEDGSPRQTRRQSKINRKNRPPTVINAEQVQKALQIHNSKSQDSSMQVSQAESPNDLLDSLETPKVTIKVTSDTVTSDPVPMPRLKRKSKLLSVSEQPETQEKQSEKKGKVGSEEDLSHPKWDTIAEETPKPDEPVIEDLEALDTATPMLPNLAKSRPKRPKMNQSRRPGAYARQNDSPAEELKADEGLDTFFSKPSVGVAVPAVNVTVTDKPPSQSSKTPPTVVSKSKKEKGFFSAKEKGDNTKESPKEPTKEKKGGFANLFKKKKSISEEAGKNEENSDKDSEKSSTKSTGFFDRNTKTRLSPFKSKKSSTKTPEKQPSDEQLEPPSPRESDPKPKPKEEVQSPPEEKAPEPTEPKVEPSPEVTLETPEETAPVEPEPETKPEPKQALKPMAGTRKVGFGTDMMAQLKQAQEKRKSQQNLLDEPDEKPKAPSPKNTPQETNGTKGIPPKAPPASNKPKPLPRVSRTDLPDGTKAGDDKRKSDGLKKPPPLRPRPPKVSPKPTSSAGDKDSVVEDKPAETGKELRMSIGEKIKKFGLDNNNSSPPEVKKKTSSLPRDTSLPNFGGSDSEDEDKVSPGWKHHSVHGTLDSSSHPSPKQETSPKDSNSPESEDDKSVNGGKSENLDNAGSLTSSYTPLDTEEEGRPEEVILV